ncbi:LysM peptidoglycan-binding domain-containing protein [Streptomyces sp. NPDC056656]|uniref:LysM peptidoglycan-binding domain-containing protein n=1 Tax=Streptomyces sp. NPDC056656 TaxID=3345895 RepID=UPI0036805A34
MPSNAAPNGAGRTIAAVLRALASLVALAAAVAGLPLLLVKATPVVWDTSHDDLAHLIDRQDTGGAFLLLLIAVAWIGWAQFVFCTLREIPAQLRGSSWHAPRGLGASQRLAAVLVGSILVLLPTGTALATPATASSAATAARVPAQAPQASQSAHGTHTAAHATADDGTSHFTLREVRPAESLWSIAEHELGDGERWRDIAELNNGRTMADGSVFHASTFLQPGWQLRMPDAPASTANAPAPQGDHTRAVTAKTGDTLWGIAENEMGDGTKYPQLFEANKGAPQPGGGTLTDPDDIRAGLKLEIPQPAAPAAPDTAKPDTTPPGTDDDRADTEHSHGDHTGSGDTEARPHDQEKHETKDPAASKAPEQDHDNGQQAPPAAPSKAEPKTPSATPSAPARPSQPASPPTASPTSAAEPSNETNEQDESGVAVAQAAGIGMLLAGSLLAAVGIKRLLQRRRRRPGQTIAMPAEPVRLEQVLEASAEPGSVQLLDRALRTLNHHAQTEGVPLPDVTGARVTARTVELILAPQPAHTTEALPPFTQHTPARWILDGQQQLLSEDEAVEIPAPYPGLTTLGEDTNGSHLLLNLTTAGVLLLDGDDDAVRATARVIALEAATSAWSDRAEILTIGLGNELPVLLPQGRMRAVPHLRAAQSDLGTMLLEHHQMPADAPDPLPWMLICAISADADAARILEQALITAGDFPVAAVLPARQARSVFPDAPVLPVGTGTPAHFELLDSDIVATAMSDQDYRELVAALRTAEEPARPAQGPWQQVPPITITQTPLLAEAGPEPAVAEAGPTSVPLAFTTARTAPAAQTATPLRVMPRPETAHDTDGTEEPGEQHPESAAPLPDTDPPAGPGEDVPTRHDDEGEDDEAKAHELHAPTVSVLGPVTVTGVEASGHGYRIALLASVLYFRPGIASDALCDAMDPRKPWSPRTLQSRISELRNRLGSDPDGNSYLPPSKAGTYRLAPTVRCDWTRFEHLAKRGLAAGGTKGIRDLQAALNLVRGRPFGGADLVWAAARTQEMLTRITDVAHTLATWHRTAPMPDLDAARTAVKKGLDVDDSAEILYQDWMLIEDAVGNRSGVTAAYDTLCEVNRRLKIGTEAETENLYDKLMRRSA